MRAHSIKKPGFIVDWIHLLQWFLVAMLPLNVIAHPSNDLDINERAICVEQTNQSTVYAAEFEECLNVKNAIPADIPLIFNVTKVNNHINILVYDNGKYDYYEHSAAGASCFSAVRMDTNPTRTIEEQMECIVQKRQHCLVEYPYAEKRTPQFRCAYEVTENENHLVVRVQSKDGMYEYIVDRNTGTTELYQYRRINLVRRQRDNCFNKQCSSEFDIPLEVTMKRTHDEKDYFEILIENHGKYDLYVTEESGFVRYTELQSPDKPNRTLDYTDKLRCQQHIDYRVFHQKHELHCPLKVVEDANHVNISVNAFHYENVYVIDKTNNAMEYYKVKDNLILSLPIPDAELNYRADVDKCAKEILNSNSTTFPIDVVKMNNFIQIWVGANGSFSVFETTASGLEMCNISISIDKPEIITMKSIEDFYPECVSCDEPAFSFNCPTVRFDEDENEEKLSIIYGPGITTYSFTVSKSTVRKRREKLFYDSDCVPMVEKEKKRKT